MHKPLKLEVNRLQQQKTPLCCTTATQVQESEPALGTVSPNLDSSGLFFQSLVFVCAHDALRFLFLADRTETQYGVWLL